MQVYFVEAKNPHYIFEWRTCSYHRLVYHGQGLRPKSVADFVRPPALTNRNREQLRIQRSGRFVPHVWGVNLALIVSDTVKTRLETLPNTEFLPVVFDWLVDVELPQIGDFSWYDRLAQVDDLDKACDLKELPNVPDFHANIGPYWEVLSAIFSEYAPRPDDTQAIEVNFGSYTGEEPDGPINVSESLSKECPFVWSDYTIVREDAFKILAPFLDLDYFNIARHDFEDHSEWQDHIRQLYEHEFDEEDPEKIK